MPHGRDIFAYQACRDSMISVTLRPATAADSEFACQVKKAACVSSLKKAKVHLYRVQGRKVHVERYGEGEVIHVAALNSHPRRN